jgi:hypothetical protein
MDNVMKLWSPLGNPVDPYNPILCGNLRKQKAILAPHRVGNEGAILPVDGHCREKADDVR